MKSNFTADFRCAVWIPLFQLLFGSNEFIHPWHLCGNALFKAFLPCCFRNKGVNVRGLRKKGCSGSMKWKASPQAIHTLRESFHKTKWELLKVILSAPVNAETTEACDVDSLQLQCYRVVQRNHSNHTWGLILSSGWGGRSCLESFIRFLKHLWCFLAFCYCLLDQLSWLRANKETERHPR